MRANNHKSLMICPQKGHLNCIFILIKCLRKYFFSLLHLASRGRSSTGVDYGLIIGSPTKTQNSVCNEEGQENENQDQCTTGTPSSVSMMMSKKYQTFIRCSVKLLISSGNKHKNFLDANSGLLQDILVQLISNIQEELSFYEGKLE